jgi:hypothetical protein
LRDRSRGNDPVFDERLRAKSKVVTSGNVLIHQGHAVGVMRALRVAQAKRHARIDENSHHQSS